MSQLGVILQETVRGERKAGTILALLREQMDDGVDGSGRRRTRMSLKERLGLKGLGCCGATWGFRPTTISVGDDDDRHQQDPPQQQQDREINVHHQASPDIHGNRISDPGCLSPAPNTPAPTSSSGMNLAAALAAERQLREGTNTMGQTTVSLTAPGTPMRVSLMRLLRETEGEDGETVGTEKEGETDRMCCVCMGRKKGAALIPCGHTYCRVCSREVWLNRGSCPLCNRAILQILDIF